jgi:hypothetical protein
MTNKIKVGSRVLLNKGVTAGKKHYPAGERFSVDKIEGIAYPLLSLMSDSGNGISEVPISWVDLHLSVSISITDISVLTQGSETIVILKTDLPSAVTRGKIATVKIDIPTDKIDSYLELNFPNIPVVRL